MTKTSEFSWDKETAKSLMDKFEAFWSQNPEQYGITGGADAATGTANARNLFMTMKNHGKTSRKNATFAGAGYIWDDLEEIIEDNLVLEDELKTFEFMLKSLEKMEGSDRDPRNIVFNTVVEYDSETGESTRDQVRGHFLTLAYWNFRKDKDSSYNVEKPKPSWVSEKKNDAEPPLWRIIFGRKNSLRTLVQDIYELAKKPTPPPTAHLDLKISSGKAGQLATIPSVQEAVRSVLNESSIYNAGKSRAPNKGRLNDAMAAMVIPSTPEIMRLVAKEATVLVENDGKTIRRKLRDFPGYEDIKSITLNFPRNNIVLNKLIREVMGDDMETFERPGRVEDGPIGLVLKAEPGDLIREATTILKRVNFKIRGEEEDGDVMGMTRTTDEGVESEVFLANNFRDMREALEDRRIQIFNLPQDRLDNLTSEQVDELEDIQFQAIVNSILTTVKHESTHWGQLTEPVVQEKTEAMISTFVNWCIDYLQGEQDHNDMLERLSDIFHEEVYFYIFKEVPAYWIEHEGITWDMARAQVRRAFVYDNPIMRRFDRFDIQLREIYQDNNFQLLTNDMRDALEAESIRIFNIAMDALAERDNNDENN